MPNIFEPPPTLPPTELFEPLASGDDVLVERIISTGQATPPGEWYDRERDEWVILLQGEATLSYMDGSHVELKAGDYVFIPAHRQHRVDRTSTAPPCIWLAVHAHMQKAIPKDV